MMKYLPSSTFAAIFLAFFTITSAYRPVQHCKHDGENGHYSACTSLAQHFNESTGKSDLFVRYHWYKYEGSSVGWHSVGLGERMAGAMMFIMYGDPTAANPELTLSIRSAEGHQPPSLIHDIAAFNIPQAEGRIPDVDIVTSKFDTYFGPLEHPETHLKPTYVGIAEFIVRGYAKWIGTAVSDDSTAQPMIWGSNDKQDFLGDYSIGRNIEMHQFGAGFGFMFADLKNAKTPIPMFGPINEQAGHKGVKELGTPDAPTPGELSTGEFAIKTYKVNSGSSTSTPNTEQSESDVPPASSTQGTTTPDAQSKPTYTIKGKTIRDWLWHLHGLLLTLSFFVLYPLGIYLLRSPKQVSNGLSFNYHWTVQSLATVTFTLGCFIGYLNSRGISILHQYIGIFIVLCMVAQMVLGWRHHVKFIEIKRRTILSKAHVWLGRIIMPVGFLNILSGMKLRHYGWFTMLLVFVLIIIEFVFGAVFLRAAHLRRNKMGGAAVAEELKAQGPGRDDDAEEYFQLAGEDDSDSENEAAASSKLAQKREENERLARLDRV